MEPISADLSVFRRLVQENEICGLIDLDHDPTSNYGDLKGTCLKLDLEKPLSCKMGTQCRFKSKCHRLNLPATTTIMVVNGQKVSGVWTLGKNVL